MSLTGKTKQSGWQVGLRKTFPISSEKLWLFIKSHKGMKIWTGDPLSPEKVMEQERQTDAGITYQITTWIPNSHIRMKWKMARWETSSILQIRAIRNSHCRSILAIHQEKLADEKTRTLMKTYWQKKMDDILNLLK